MKSPEFIRAKLVNFTNADCSEHTVKNNRYHYTLRFEESIGWDWVDKQIYKSSKKLDTELEAYKIRPSGVNDFELEVREVERRKNIDDGQHGLSDFAEE